MSGIMIKLSVLIVAFICFSSTAIAGNNSYSIMVSCTIPAIPGVNAPLIEEQAVTNTDQQQAEEKEMQVEKEQTIPSAEEGSFVITKTIYSR